ncbi:MBL fold metallo-hydrolase [Acetobacterium bakii]|uniref:Metallo-beta-lactamase n=1 Tax=Acetobacterium bakii TaxID=52689 RepID=A0A0L6TYU1_9FIRM|nr:MBL fold metallo-hydrolase [Acetobacterium bakii]KNZ40740.1 metallo-beta-lactamase [Acetobacterium bakii]
MKIVTLTENTSVSEKYKNEHGLSFYIETETHKLLFDVGASGLFAENAEKLGIDLSKVDLLVISHGHYDHGGGLKTFLEINDKASIYLSRQSFENHYSDRGNGDKVYIGLDQELFSNKRFVFLESDFVIDDELCIFSKVQGDKYKSTANANLLMEKEGVLVCDDFSHEQNLIIRERDQVVLLAGCAHRGIVNILDHMALNYDMFPTTVIGGFHLYNRSRKKPETKELIENIGSELKKTQATYYTCHCTGEEPYQMLKTMLGDHVNYLATGSRVEI